MPFDVVITQEFRDLLTIALTFIASMLVLGVLVTGTSQSLKE